MYYITNLLLFFFAFNRWVNMHIHESENNTKKKNEKNNEDNGRKYGIFVKENSCR